jgi:hypothetical protein
MESQPSYHDHSRGRSHQPFGGFGGLHPHLPYDTCASPTRQAKQLRPESFRCCLTLSGRAATAADRRRHTGASYDQFGDCGDV